VPPETDDGIVGDRHATQPAPDELAELAAQALAATAKFRSVFNQSGMFAGIMDLDGTLREVNELSLKACGYRAEDALGLPFWETPWWRGSGDVQATIRDAVERARTGEVFKATLPYWLADGSERIVEFAMHPIRDESGSVLFLSPTGIDITDRVRAEALLRRNHETFFNLVQNSPFGIYVVDADFKLRQVGKGAQRVFEHVRPLLGRDFADVLRQIWVEPFASEAIARFRHTLATGEPYVAVDTTEQRHDLDAVESYDWRIERITLPDGQYGVVCYFYDLTEIRRVQEELRYRSRQFQTLIDKAPLGVLLVDADFRLTQVNPAGMPAFTGIAGLVGRSIDEVTHILWPAPRAEEITRVFRRTLETGEPFHMPELDEVRADRGVVEYYDWRVERITLPDGRFGIVCYFRDISEQVRSRRAIAASEARYRTLFESIDEAFCVLEVIFDAQQRPVDFRYIELNPAFEKQSGLHGALGRRASEVIEHEAHWFETYGRVASTGEPVRFQSSAQALDRWFDVYAFRIGEPHEHRVAVLFRDITAQRHAEESVRFHIAELKTAQNALQDADRRKDEFLATLAHELRNPLAAIRMALGVLSRGQNDPGHVARMRTIIDRQSAQLVRLIDDLLDVSRITRGKLELRKEPTRLAATIEHAVEGVAAMAEAKGLRLSVRQADDSLVVHADAQRFAQVISNLLNNACKFTEPGGAIDVWAERDADSAVVHVRDTGAGIPPGDLARVFDMFAQVDGPEKQHAGGLGIGLSLARSIVTLHGGTIEARSDGPGRGSEFIVRIPLVADASHTPARAHDGGAVSDTRRARSTVLAIDDNRDALDAVTLMLQMAGFTVVTGSDGGEAVELARTERPAALLLDIGLPGLDGYEIARQIRREPWGASMRLVAMTGWGQEKDKEKAREAGFDAHLTKPVDAEELVRVLADMGDRRALT
jgi:PAS domain S-box-containing protein